MQIYERIFQLLEEKGISQKELSLATGIRQSTISDWKNKRVNPSADRIVIISKALQVSPAMLLTGEEEPGSDYVAVEKETKESLLIENFRGMEARQQELLLKYAEELKTSC